MFVACGAPSASHRPPWGSQVHFRLISCVPWVPLGGQLPRPGRAATPPCSPRVLRQAGMATRSLGPRETCFLHGGFEKWPKRGKNGFSPVQTKRCTKRKTARRATSKSSHAKTPKHPKRHRGKTAKASGNMREIVHIQGGQCGNQIGAKFWEVRTGTGMGHRKKQEGAWKGEGLRNGEKPGNGESVCFRGCRKKGVAFGRLRFLFQLRFGLKVNSKTGTSEKEKRRTRRHACIETFRGGTKRTRMKPFGVIFSDLYLSSFSSPGHLRRARS